jgi:predicted esterase YcpF (UPF0227 family)
MTERYAGCRMKLLEGGDHALSDFGEHIAEVFDFLGLVWPSVPQTQQR